LSGSLPDQRLLQQPYIPFVNLHTSIVAWSPGGTADQVRQLDLQLPWRPDRHSYTGGEPVSRGAGAELSPLPLARLSFMCQILQVGRGVQFLCDQPVGLQRGIGKECAGVLRSGGTLRDAVGEASGRLFPQGSQPFALFFDDLLPGHCPLDLPAQPSNLLGESL